MEAQGTNGRQADGRSQARRQQKSAVQNPRQHHRVPDRRCSGGGDREISSSSGKQHTAPTVQHTQHHSGITPITITSTTHHTTAVTQGERNHAAATPAPAAHVCDRADGASWCGAPDANQCDSHRRRHPPAASGPSRHRSPGQPHPPHSHPRASVHHSKTSPASADSQWRRVGRRQTCGKTGH